MTASAGDIQVLLRFLAQDAKVPLAQAIGKVKDLQTAKLVTPADIAKSSFDEVKAVFEDEKIAKQVLSSAKRVVKKRTASSDSPSLPSPKKPKPSYGQPLTPAELEASLELPSVSVSESMLSDVVIYTNRAPLVLAFAATLLEFTMPAQPLSSRLSLAQAVVSANSRTKAVSLGIEQGKSAEEEGWGEGHPIIKIMGREVRVMKRWGYQWDALDEEGASQETIKEATTGDDDPALWGVDLEALRKKNNPGTSTARGSQTNQLPIYTAQSARAYLLKSFETPKSEDTSSETPPKKGAVVAQKEQNLALLLGALRLVFESWSSVLSKDDLDRRAWAWYVTVRPEVEAGVAGWGAKGPVKLADVLALRRPAQ
ncbi:hypothetical protein BU24DRAFT_417172 [Aaosphaeria arxii CBS 175.79]|uniref:Impact N-terminal domain-containing protein n=1 Tax=Aaosphaeria arxii CBS 175.79 TaxID=1450172 RepID=A0A6A5Y7J5_9PLEO|nr:uncharacterized protein BU24DRAFT_417172 [Aaosphaeria arxii CBS 175.79]KAF2021532.1 hypothetical protein BU24DRAFT_417172 [Aaosphaeria arxii CBS 175.79]